MHEAYFETRFRVGGEHAWPGEFAIISAYPTTGTTWPASRIDRADEMLRNVIASRGVWMARLTGFSPKTGHAEPSWAAAIGYDEACDLGRDFLQDAIYWVDGDVLSVSYCDARRRLELVGPFRERVVR
jgi:hypothetical protein